MADLATPSTTGSSSSYLLGLYYDKVLIKNLSPELRMYQLASKRPLPKGISTTITFTKLTKFTPSATTLTEGVPPSPTWLTATQITAAVKGLGEYTPVSDLLQMSALDPVIEDVTALQGRQAAQAVDSWLIYRCHNQPGVSEDAAFTQLAYNSTLPSTSATTNWSMLYPMGADNTGFSSVYLSENGTPITTKALLVNFLSVLSTAAVVNGKLSVKNVQAAVRLLERDNVPTFSDGTYAMVIHPDCVYDILRDPEFVQWNAYQNSKETMWKGEVARINKVRFLTSTNIPKHQGGSLSVTAAGQFSMVHNILIGPDALAVTEIDGNIKTYRKEAGSSGSVDPINQVATVGWKYYIAARVIDPKRGRVVLNLIQ